MSGTAGAFHLNPDNRPQAARFRIDTVSLRGLFNQQIHGSKRSLRSVEDCTEVEQRTAYFDGDQGTSAKKGVHLPDRASQVAMTAQLQNMLDFPPAPKLNPLGKLDPEKATEEERLGQEIFFGKGQSGVCHPTFFYLDDKMHDLKVERFYTNSTDDQWPVDSCRRPHQNLLGLRLNHQEKQALVAFMPQL